MSTTKEKKATKEKGYVLRTYGLNKNAFKDFEDKVSELEKYAKEKGFKPPVKGDLMSRLIVRYLSKITPSNFYN